VLVSPVAGATIVLESVVVSSVVVSLVLSPHAAKVAIAKTNKSFFIVVNVL
jgi:hypothetical protein